ncbi:cytochrome c biogenesis CcdA family protein [Micromonospora globbae]|uniref:cytochrome c biogenesis CcdA family protein n=1 Tax=Micromonospora globbae TaxID=1894969 RepID=UPI0034453E9A
MGETFAEIASSGPLLLAIGVSALAGLVSFFAPCMLPLVPGYLSYVTGLAGADLPSARRSPPSAMATTPGNTAVATAVVDGPVRVRRARAVAGSTLFVLGFTTVFVIISYAFGALGRALLVHYRAIEIAAGALTIALGLAFADVIPGLTRTWRINRLPKAGLAGAPLLGAVFALSWTPCLSPTLTAVLGLATVQGSAGRGATLAAAYSLGMGLPFIGFGFGFPRLLRAVGFVRRHGPWVTRIGGVLLVAVGLALVTGAWTEFVNWLRATVGPGQIGI